MLNDSILGVTFGTGGRTKVTPKLVPFSVSVLAVVANEIEPPQIDVLAEGGLATLLLLSLLH